MEESLHLEIFSDKIEATNNICTWTITTNRISFLHQLAMLIEDFSYVGNLTIREEGYDSIPSHNRINIISDFLTTLSLTNMGMFQILAPRLQCIHVEHISKKDLETLPSIKYLIIGPFCESSRCSRISYLNGQVYAGSEDIILDRVDHFRLMSSKNPMKRAIRILNKFLVSRSDIEILAVGSALDLDYIRGLARKDIR